MKFLRSVRPTHISFTTLGCLSPVRSSIIALLLACLATAGAACGGEGAADNKVASLEITPSSGVVEVGATISFTATPRNAAGDLLFDHRIIWHNLDNYAELIAEGELQGSRVGTAHLSCTCDDVVEHITLRVVPSGALLDDAGVVDADVVDGSDDPAPGAAVDSISLTPSSGAVVAKGTRQLTATLLDAEGNEIEDGRAITWLSSDKKVATVDAQGFVTGTGTGSTTISASCEGKSASAKIKGYPAVSGMVTAGGRHACGLTTSGVAYCWGASSDGALGIGPDFPRVTGEDHVVNYIQIDPAPVRGGHLFRTLSAGNQYTCGISVEGDTYCWGRSIAIGDSDVIDVSEDAMPTPEPALVAGGHAFTSISAGTYVTCALTKAGAAYCWGVNVYGQLGDGTKTERGKPTAVVGGHVFTQIEAGSTFTVALGKDGLAYHWGQVEIANELVELTEPTPVPGDHNFVDISASDVHVLALDTDGNAWAWGSNQSGLLGDGTAAPHSAPALVSGGYQFTAISAGGMSSAIGTDGKLYWWGHFGVQATLDDVLNGNDRSRDYLEPYPFGTYGFTQLTAGGNFLLATTPDGSVSGLGNNGDAQLALGEELYTRESPDTQLSSYTLSLPATAIAVDSGGSFETTINVERHGGFTLNGIGFSKPIMLSTTLASGDSDSVGGADGLNATITPSVLNAGQNSAVLKITSDSGDASARGVIGVQSNADGQTTQSAVLTVDVSEALPAGDTLDLVCDSESTPLDHQSGSSNRYHCMASQDGIFAPGQYAGGSEIALLTRLTSGVWVDETVGVCIFWGRDYSGHSNPSQAFVRALNGGNSLAGPKNSPLGKWGVLVKKSGIPEGGSQWLVFTDKADPQIRGLSVEMSTDPPTIVGWSFTRRATCPW